MSQSNPQLILPKDVDSKFRFITVASQRAKQLWLNLDASEIGQAS